MPKQAAPATVQEYIAQFPADVQKSLRKLRATIKKAAPDAEERISYQIPGYFLNGRLVWFAGFKDHISFFPTGSGVSAFAGALRGYKTNKGTVQFKLDEPIPYDLVTRIVKYRVKENKAKRRAEHVK